MRSDNVSLVVSGGVECTGGRRREWGGGFCETLLSRLLTVLNAIVWNGELPGLSAILHRQTKYWVDVDLKGRKFRAINKIRSKVSGYWLS